MSAVQDAFNEREAERLLKTSALEKCDELKARVSRRDAEIEAAWHFWEHAVISPVGHFWLSVLKFQARGSRGLLVF